MIYRSAQETIIKARGKGLVMTDLVVAVPEGYYGRVGMIRSYSWWKKK